MVAASIDPAQRVWLRRAYDDPSSRDGARILVDRIWPRGVSKDEAHLEEWLREVAPSDELRRWFGHDPAKWDEFRSRYLAELEDHTEALRHLEELARHRRVTIVAGARDIEHCNGTVIRDLLRQRLSGS